MRRISAFLVLVTVANGCGSVRDEGGTGGVPLLTPGEAAGRSADASVQGFFWARPDQGTALLCEAALESFPPQCGGESVAVDGVDIPSLAGVEFNQNIFWAEDVRIRGRLADGTLESTSVELNTRNQQNGLSFRVVVPLEVSSGGVTWLAILTNSGGVSVDVRFTDGQSAEVILTDPDTGDTVYEWSQGQSFTAAMRTEALSPGETVRFALSDKNFDLASGVYDIEGFLTGSPSPGAVFGRVVVPWGRPAAAAHCAAWLLLRPATPPLRRLNRRPPRVCGRCVRPAPERVTGRRTECG